MKTESFSKPSKKYIIEEPIKGRCRILFFDNITEEQRQQEDKEVIVYIYDMYVINPYYRSNLKEDIEANYQLWFDMAKQQEYDTLAEEIREKRDKLLAQTDWTQMIDTALSKEEQERYKKYRQALRDIPEQEGFPYNIDWPEKTTEVQALLDESEG